jgi:hypothetical protein
LEMMRNVRGAEAKVSVEYDDYVPKGAPLLSIQAPHNRFYSFPFRRTRPSLFGRRRGDRCMLGMACGLFHAVNRCTSIARKTVEKDCRYHRCGVQ